jgi:membrane associated rhomboid family serine protease
MLLIPIDRPLDWRNPPIVTLLLVLLNCAIYFIWQHDDDAKWERAEQHYVESGLHNIEMTYYYRYLHPGNSQAVAPANFARNGKRLQEMKRDGVFQNKLQHDEIITSAAEVYSRWKPQRNHYDALISEVVSYKYGIIPSNPSVVGMFTSMFLHGSVGHLFGNMVMLMIIGYVVEIILGHLVYLAGYLLAGLAGNALYVVISPHLHAPGVGASGAIVGVLGMYLVLFWLRKIRFFFFLIYFNYFRAPAIVMLVPVIIWQLYMEFGMDTDINVMAHLGGLAGGALVAVVAKRFLSQTGRDYLDHDVKAEKYQHAVSTGQQQLANMNIKAARQTYTDLVRDFPDDLAIKLQLFNILKLTPEDPEFHNLALLLLKLPGADRNSAKILHDVFIEYAGKAKPKPQFNPELLMTLALRFAAHEYLEDAEKLVNYLLQAKRDFARNAEGLAALVKYYQGKDRTKVDHYRALLLQTYPHSMQAQHLQRADPAT